MKKIYTIAAAALLLFAPLRSATAQVALQDSLVLSLEEIVEQNRAEVKAAKKDYAEIEKHNKAAIARLERNSERP